jgi:hypothetical protein
MPVKGRSGTTSRLGPTGGLRAVGWAATRAGGLEHMAAAVGAWQAHVFFPSCSGVPVRRASEQASDHRRQADC